MKPKPKTKHIIQEQLRRLGLIEGPCMAVRRRVVRSLGSFGFTSRVEWAMATETRIAPKHNTA